MPIKVIDIKEGSRLRQSYRDIESLAEAIKDKGLLQPIILRDDMTLIAGGRRLRAIKFLGWDEIPDNYISIRSDISELELREMEVMENLERDDLTWQEKLCAKAELDKLKKEMHGDAYLDKTRGSWSTRKSAGLLGESVGNYSEDLNLHKAMQEIPELAECETKTDAKRMFNKLFSRHERDTILQKASKDENLSIKFAENHFRIGDAIEGLKSLSSTTAYFAEVDPPYSVDLVKSSQMIKGKKKADPIKRYKEIDKKDYPKVCTQVAEELYRVLHKDAWVIWWFGYEWYDRIYKILTKTGFKVDVVPLIWYKIDGSSVTPNAKCLLPRDYEQAFICRKGQPRIENMHGSVYPFKGVSGHNRTCSAEKPIELYEAIIDTFLPKVKCIGIIPFLGSGKCLQALYRKGHTGLGWDLDEENKKYFLGMVYNDLKNKQ